MRKRKKQNPEFLKWAFQSAEMPSSAITRGAYELWLRQFPFRRTELRLRPFIPFRAHGDWLRQARESLFLSMGSVAVKMNVARGTYAKIEKSERALTIKLGTLIKAAAAMDCEIIYVIRPKTCQSFAQIVWTKLISRAKDHVLVRNASTGNKEWALANVALRLMEDTRFRQDMGWVEKRPLRRRPE